MIDKEYVLNTYLTCFDHYLSSLKYHNELVQNLFTPISFT